MGRNGKILEMGVCGGNQARQEFSVAPTGAPGFSRTERVLHLGGCAARGRGCWSLQYLCRRTACTIMASSVRRRHTATSRGILQPLLGRTYNDNVRCIYRGVGFAGGGQFSLLRGRRTSPATTDPTRRPPSPPTPSPPSTSGEPASSSIKQQAQWNHYPTRRPVSHPLRRRRLYNRE